jgi:hypothetical protein
MQSDRRAIGKINLLIMARAGRGDKPIKPTELACVVLLSDFGNSIHSPWRALRTTQRPVPDRAMPHNREESGNSMTDQKAQELTDTELDAGVAERDKADRVSLPGRNVGSGAQRKRSALKRYANLPIKTLAERDKADKAWLPWPQSGERRTAHEVREFTDQELDAALAERDKADKASKASLSWPECGERPISKDDRRNRIVAP